MFAHINNRYAFIAFILTIIVLTLLLIIALYLLIRKDRYIRFRYGNSELELLGGKKKLDNNESCNEHLYPFFTKMVLYRDNDLLLGFDLTKWNEFLGYHVCYILYTNYIEFAQRLIADEIVDGKIGLEFMKVLEISKKNWLEADLSFNGYKLKGIPPLMLKKFHQIRQNEINFLTEWISDVDCCALYQNKKTKKAVILEILSFALTWIGRDYTKILITMNGDLDRLCPDPDYEAC